ncbi:MAG: hypothetical protein CMJ25_15295 [Phycisphaerae bacterium]|nr:hypothetical protein [Phycisphaerae bacterium]
MSELNVFLLGQPIGKGRPRFTRSGHTYTPDKTRKYEMRLAAEGSDVMHKIGLDPVAVPCRVFVRATFQIPKSWTKKKKLQAERREIYPKRPDADNVAKIALDALNGVIFEDDDQVYDLRVNKAYGNNPSLSVTVYW